ncbi:MAG: hypothetical protein O6942_01535 [Bacteroidetes bacterium]|nr:hypothetical protein [Bacteroidota bacterium]MCZ6757282.1 hypothetical protein [Bacteroidota bacterium]
MIGQTVRNNELHLQLENIAEAVDAYEIFVDIWKDADAVLQLKLNTPDATSTN